MRSYRTWLSLPSRFFSGSTRLIVGLLQLFAPLIPIVQPFPDARFKAPVGRLVKCLRPHFRWPIILARKSFVGIVVVGVILAVADILHELCRSIEDVHRRHQRA